MSQSGYVRGQVEDVLENMEYIDDETLEELYKKVKEEMEKRDL